jgi:DNA polymerase I-like protein with 3'-5' exonuclease and polymerase domains
MGQWGDELWKSAYSMLPQSTVVDSVNQGMVKIYNDSEICGTSGYNADILAQVHDSVLFQIPISSLQTKESFENLREKIRSYMDPELTYYGRTFTIATDYKFGTNWGSFDKEKNKGGMQEFEDYDTFVLKMKDWESINDQRTLGELA